MSNAHSRTPSADALVLFSVTGDLSREDLSGALRKGQARRPQYARGQGRHLATESSGIAKCKRSMIGEQAHGAPRRAAIGLLRGAGS